MRKRKKNEGSSLEMIAEKRELIRRVRKRQLGVLGHVIGKEKKV